MTTDDRWDVGAAKGMKGGEPIQWGLVSFSNGVVSIFGALIAALVNVSFWRSPPAGLPHAVAFAGAVAGLLVTLGVVGFGNAVGVKGRRPIPNSRGALLATAGIAIGTAAMYLWVIVGIDLLASLSAFTG
jgi:hypothetical protein